MFAYCLARDINNFHDVENVLLCWPTFKTTMLKHLLMNSVISMWFWIYCKNHHRVYIPTVTGICVGSQGNVREKSGIFFLPTPWQPCLTIWAIRARNLRYVYEHWRWRYKCFWSKVNIWNVNCAWETAFIFDTQTDVLVTVSKFLRQKNVSTWEGLEPPTFRFMLNALTIWAIRARHLLSYVFEHLLWWYRYFWSKVNIWNVNCAWAAAFIFNTQTDVLMKVSKVFWDRKCLDLRETGTPNLPIHAECSNHLSYQGQFLPPRVSVLARLYIIAMSHECHGTSDHWHFDCSKLCITDISCRESTGDQCIPSTKGQQIIFIIRDLCVSQGLWHSGDIGHPDWAIDLVI